MHIKVIFRHVICWLLWFSATNVYTIQHFESIPKWSLAFNITSSLLLFYIMYSLSCSYNRRVNFAEGFSKTKSARWRYFLLRTEFAVAVGVTLAYCVGSWGMDLLFDKIGHTENGFSEVSVWQYMDSKFARGSFFISTGIACGLLKITLQRKNEIIAAQKALNIITMQENALMKNTYSKRVKEMRNMVKSALADKDEE